MITSGTLSIDGGPRSTAEPRWIAGPPATADEADRDFPAKVTNDYPLHGRLSGEPATLVGYGTSWDGDECTVWAEGLIRQASVFGEVLELRRRIDCRVGTNEVRLRDTVVNARQDLAVYEHYRAAPPRVRRHSPRRRPVSP